MKLNENYNTKTLKIEVNKANASSEEAKELNDKIERKIGQGEDPREDIKKLN